MIRQAGSAAFEEDQAVFEAMPNEGHLLLYDVSETVMTQVAEPSVRDRAGSLCGG